MKANNISQPQRKQTSVVLEGIDTSTPNDIVKDGKCETLLNLRFKDNAWRPVGEYDIKGAINGSNIDIVYHHPAAGEKSYIIHYIEGGKHCYSLVTLGEDNTFSVAGGNKGELIASFDEEMKISHFGKVLFLSNNDSIHQYIYDGLNNAYIRFQKPTPPILKQESQTWGKRGVNEGGDISSPDADWIDISNITKSIPPTHYQAEVVTYYPGSIDANNFKKFKEKWDTNAFVALWQLADNEGDLLISNYAQETEIDGYWWGEIAYFACYRMADGTILSPTPLAVWCSEVAPPNKRIQTLRKYDDGYTYLAVYNLKENESGEMEGVNTPIKDLISPQMQYGVCKATITIPKDINKDLISEVCIYSTRINPIFDIGDKSVVTYDNEMLSKEKISSTDPDIEDEYHFTFKGLHADKSTHFANNKLAEQPFYLIESIPIGSFTPASPAAKFMSKDITIDYYMLKDAVSKPVYTPNNNIHELLWDRNLDFNNRLHLLGAKQNLLNSPDTIEHYGAGVNTEHSCCWDFLTDLRIENQQYTASPIGEQSFSGNYEWIGWAYPSLYCASYHDYRAYLIRGLFFDKVTNKILKQKQIPLSPSIGNNIAYFTLGGSILKYAHIPFAEAFNVSASGIYKKPTNDQYLSTNKVMVSALNNPLSWPFENSYAIGSESSKILALQSAAIEMSDAKFGEMPLYAFTEEGIFALQAGENTLYSSVIPINYDKIINPDVLAINYSLAYITEKGLHLLNNQGNTLISSPLNTMDGKPLDAWKSIKLLNPQSFNEIICYDENTATAYIYNLDYQYWSTRHMYGHVINNTESVSTATGYGNIYDISRENPDNPSQFFRIITRPIKLGDLDFKRLETIIPRMTGDCNIAFNIEASNDCKEWMALRDFSTLSIAQPFTIRRTPFSAKYFRFVIISTMSDVPIALTNIDIEWYHKFLRRMR